MRRTKLIGKMETKLVGKCRIRSSGVAGKEGSKQIIEVGRDGVTRSEIG